LKNRGIQTELSKIEDWFLSNHLAVIASWYEVPNATKEEKALAVLAEALRRLIIK